MQYSLKKIKCSTFASKTFSPHCWHPFYNGYWYKGCQQKVFRWKSGFIFLSQLALKCQWLQMSNCTTRTNSQVLPCLGSDIITAAWLAEITGLNLLKDASWFQILNYEVKCVLEPIRWGKLALILQDGTLTTWKSQLKRKMSLVVILYPAFWHVTCSDLLCESCSQRNVTVSELCQFAAKTLWAIIAPSFLFSFHQEKGMFQMRAVPSAYVPEGGPKLINQNVLWENNKLVFLSYWDFWGPFVSFIKSE